MNQPGPVPLQPCLCLRRVSDHLDAVDTQRRGAWLQLPQVVGALVAQPALRALAEGQFQPQRHFRSDRRVTVDNVGQRLARHTQLLSSRSDR